MQLSLHTNTWEHQRPRTFFPCSSDIRARLMKNQYQVHPLYQIYLSFFAASSIELTSRSLHLNSSTKLPLLQEALSYYQKAESQMEYASFSADPTIVQAVRQTRHDSVSPSIRSSIDSIFSHTSSRSSTASSVAPSPTSPCCPSSTEEVTPTHKHTLSAPASNPGGGLAPAPLKVKKKVSFSLQLPCHLSEAELQLADDTILISAFSNPPTPISAPLSPAEESSISDFLLSRALIRYRGYLSDLHNQINYHIGSVKSQISALNKSRKVWRSNLPNIFTVFRKGGMADVDEDEMKKADLRARIQSLKESGWKRDRFDGRRYRELCDKALGELE